MLRSLRIKPDIKRSFISGFLHLILCVIPGILRFIALPVSKPVSISLPAYGILFRPSRIGWFGGWRGKRDQSRWHDRRGFSPLSSEYWYL